MMINLIDITRRLGKNRELTIRSNIETKSPTKLGILFNINKKKFPQNPKKRLHFYFDLIILFFHFNINCYPVDGETAEKIWDEEVKKEKEEKKIHHILRNYKVRVNRTETLEWVYFVRESSPKEAEELVKDYIKNNYDPDTTINKGIKIKEIIVEEENV